MEIVLRSIGDDTGPLASGEIHLWTCVLDGMEPPASDRVYLAPSELERAGKFRMDRVRNQFIAARATLRKLLAGYLDCEPAAVPIIYESTGKPMLPGHILHFNVTHTDGIGAFAFRKAGRVGVDIEKDREVDNAASLVERFFAANETAAFLDLDEGQRRRAFLRMWTRKEAILKAVGQGIHALDACEISVHPDEEPRVLKLFEDRAPKWKLHDWSPAEGYVAALAVED